MGVEILLGISYTPASEVVSLFLFLDLLLIILEVLMIGIQDFPCDSLTKKFLLLNVLSRYCSFGLIIFSCF